MGKKEYPEKPMLATECCSCFSQRGVDKDYCPHPRPSGCKGSDCHKGCNGDGSDGIFYNNEISKCTADQVARTDLREDVAGTFLWSAFDYLGESRGWPQTVKCRGAVADVAGFTKESAYWLRSWWLANISTSDAGRPDVRLPNGDKAVVFVVDTWKAVSNSHDLVTPRHIHVYSNAYAVRLLLNDKEVANSTRIIPFFGAANFTLPFVPGNLTAVAVD